MGTQGTGFGCAYNQTHLSHTGTTQAPKSLYTAPDSFGGRPHGSQFASYLGKLPKMNLPLFDGENPKLWQSRCEDYFQMYSVDSSVWIKVASMHFSGPAARWLQSVESQLSKVTWRQFGDMIKDHFGKDQHDHLLRQLFILSNLVRS
jgi:hypothetical protein